MERLRRFWPVLFLLVLPAIPLWRAVFLGETIGPFDQIRQMAPWNGPKPEAPWDVLQADGVLQFYPWRDLVLSSWGKLQPPFWNPYQLAGTPLLANSQSAGFYPPHILLGILHVPVGIAITLLAWAHLFWAGLGVYALVRKMGGTRLGGAVGGASFGTSAFMLGWVPLSSVIYTVSWIPWVLTGIIGIFGRVESSQGGQSVRRSILLLAASSAMMILSGHLQFVAYGFMAAAVTAVVQAISTVSKKPPSPALQFSDDLSSGSLQNSIWSSLKVLSALAIGALLAAPQLLTVLDYSKYSHRRNTPSEEGYAAYIGSSITFQDFLSRLVNPFSQGNPLERLSPEVPYSTFWPALAKHGPNWAESAVTIGPLVLLLLCLLPLARPDWRKASGVVAITVFAMLLGIGTPLNKLLYMYVPGWSSTGSPSRVLCLFVLGACALAGLAIRDDLTKVPRKNISIALGVFVVLTALTLMPTSAPAPQGMNEEAWNGIVASGNLTGMPTTVLAILLALAGVAAFLFSKEERPRYALLFVAPVFALLAYSQIVRTGESSFLKPSADAGHERIAAPYEAWALVTAAPAVLPPNTATAMRLHDIAGYDSLLHRDTVAMLNDINGKDSAPEANGNIMLVKPGADEAKLSAAGVTRILTPEGMQSLDGPGRVSLSQGTARIEEEGLDRIRIAVSGSGRLVLRDRNLPGWSAAIDGKATEIMGSTWRELDVPEGASVVTMRYVPPGLSYGLILFLLGATSLGWLAAISRNPRVRKAEERKETERLAEAA